jgi:spore germination cell wall hydrolase CwlJ-like protein
LRLVSPEEDEDRAGAGAGALAARSRTAAATVTVAAVVAAVVVAGWQIHSRHGNPGEARAPSALRAPGALRPSRELARARDEMVVTASRLMPLDPARAEQVNAAIPLAAPGPMARPFYAGKGETAQAALACLTRAVYYEAANEPIEGQRAVAQVVLNRTRHPAYPNSVCGVVYQGSERRTGCQFTFTCDGSLYRRPLSTLYARAEMVARQALAGHVEKEVGWATHYHADYVVPYWASRLDKVAVLGRHIFYRWADGWSNPAVFRRPYSGIEVDPASSGASTLPPEMAASALVTAEAGVVEQQPADLVAGEAPKLAGKTGPLAADEAAGQLKTELATTAKLRVDEQASRLP